VLDIQTKADVFNNSGNVSVYGGSHGNITTSAEYGGTVGQTQYYVSGRYYGSSVGIENPTPAYNAIHDNTSQEKGFLYLSTVIDPTSRLTFISGVSNGAYQIPNNPGQTPVYSPFGITSFDSSLLNERQQEFNQFNVLAYQKSVEDFDFQLSYFNRYSSLHFMPDPIGDLVFNGVASDVYRQSFINGIQEDTSYRVGFAHTLKFGFRPAPRIHWSTTARHRSILIPAAACRPIRRHRCSIPTPRPVTSSAPISRTNGGLTTS